MISFKAAPGHLTTDDVTDRREGLTFRGMSVTSFIVLAE